MEKENKRIGGDPFPKDNAIQSNPGMDTIYGPGKDGQSIRKMEIKTISTIDRIEQEFQEWINKRFYHATDPNAEYPEEKEIYTAGRNKAIDEAVMIVAQYCEPSHKVFEQLQSLKVKQV